MCARSTGSTPGRCSCEQRTATAESRTPRGPRNGGDPPQAVNLGRRFAQCGTASHFQPAQAAEESRTVASTQTRRIETRMDIFFGLLGEERTSPGLIDHPGARPTPRPRGNQVAGTSKVNVEPAPSHDSTQILPFICRTSSCEM